MKKFNLWLLLSLFVSAFMFTACSSSDDDGGGQGGGGDLPIPMTMAKLSGFVYTSYGAPLAGVTVTSGTTTVTTNEHGAFTLSSVKIQNGRSIVKFSHPFYNDIVRSVEAKDGDVWEVTLLDKISTSFDASAGKTLATIEGMKVDIPANAVKTTNGDAYTGTVNMEMSYLSPNDENFTSSMPGGDLAATGYGEKDPSNPNPQLISYGMTNVSLSDADNNPLLLDGKATLTFPAPDGLEAHEKIPLWSFNEETGLWDYEGEAIKQDDGTYKGEVEHFSWHNLDYPEKRATCKVVVKDANGRAIGFQKVIVGQVQATTDENGEFSCNVPIKTPFDVAVRSVDYSNYAPEVSQKVTITTAGETRIVTLTLPATSTLKGTITNKGAGTQVSLTLTYGDKAIKPVMSGTNGRYIMNLPVGYTGPATLDILAADGTIFKKNIMLTGVDQTVDYAIDAPEVAKGSVTFTGESVSKSFEIKDIPAYSLGGVVILGNQFELLTSHAGHHGSGSGGDAVIGLSIDGNYDPNVSGYTGSFSVWQETEKESYSINSDYESPIGIGITRNGNIFNISVNGSGTYYGPGIFNVKGTISGSFPCSLLAEVVETGSSTSPASWVPQLSGKTPKHAATILENPKLGSGWYYEYNSDETLDEYKALVNSAKAQMGEPYFVDDDADDENNKLYVFISGNQYLAISYNGYASSSSKSDLYAYEIFSSYGGNARIKIQAYSNVTVPFTELVSGSHFR